MAKVDINWIGRTIAGRYRIEAFLERGGMSTVYRADDPNLQRKVAVKLIHPHLSNNPEFITRFEREAAAIAQLRHPNIVQVYDFNHEGNLYFMVLEYVPGETLQARLKTYSAINQRFLLSQTVDLMARICETVAYAHRQGMIHRDLKPANVMLNPKGQPILMDFGVAKMLGDAHQTLTGTIIGTAKYMSPEQARGEHPDERADIYSLGVMLYEIVAGQCPFEADSDVDMLVQHATQPVPDIRLLNQNTPESLVAIIERALAKKTKDRYQSASDMANALRAVELPSFQTVPSTARAPSLTDPTVAETPIRQRNKRIWLVGAIAAVALVLILGLGAVLLALRFFNTSSEEDQASIPTEEEQAAEPSPPSSVEEETLALAEEVENLPTSAGMVKIAGGSFTLGQDLPGQNYVSPEQMVLTEFWIDQFEVTNAQFADFLEDTGGQAPINWPNGEMPGGQEQYPVKGVTWQSAAAFCNWTKKRLPTEAEWEAAARGPQSRLYPWGDEQRAVELPRSGTYAVGTIAANRSPSGAFDMAGNVWEWVGETYAPVPGGDRVLRGGENGFLKDMAYRLIGSPDNETFIQSAGFRCAADQVQMIEAVANVLYEDDFSDPTSGWINEDKDGAPYRAGYHPPDYYHVEVRAPNESIVIARQGDFDNVTVETELFVDFTDTDKGDFRYGLALRHMADDQFYAFTISPRTGTWFVLKQTPGELEVLDQGSISTLTGLTAGQSDRLRVDARGANFAFYIDDALVTQLADTAYASGTVGFYVETFDESLAHVHYDSLVIREVEEVAEPLTTVLYEDKFADPASGWMTEDVAGEPYRVGYHPPDYYHVEVRAAGEHTAVFEDRSFEDVTVETDLFVDFTDTDEGDFRYGLALRQVADDQFYAFTISPRTGTWFVLKETPDGPELLAEGTVDTLEGLTPGVTDHLRVDAQGDHFVFHINGEPVTQVTDAAYASGTVGFYVETFDESLAHVHYDSLVIREVDASAFELIEPATPTPPSAPEGMVLIPAGYFTMGSSSGQRYEQPAHPVFLDAFYLDLYEVTNAQYRECVLDRGCTQAGSPNSTTYKNYRDDPAYDDYPVVSVTWDQTDAYCKWAGKHLPTEAQWEYAARGPDNFIWPWGDTFQVDLTTAGETDTQPVGSYADGVSPFGVFDMAGNVAEWVLDDFDEAFYENSPASNPVSQDISAGRIFRGGSYDNRNGTVYTTSRRDGNIRTYSNVDVGFRCALDAPELTSPEERGELLAEFCEVYAEYKPEALCP